MTTDDYKSRLALELANKNVNELLASLAGVCAQRDELQAEVADLKAKLSPQPAPEAPAAP